MAYLEKGYISSNFGLLGTQSTRVRFEIKCEVFVSIIYIKVYADEICLIIFRLTEWLPIEDLGPLPNNIYPFKLLYFGYSMIHFL
jgi:hypothetical protein